MNPSCCVFLATCASLVPENPLAFTHRGQWYKFEKLVQLFSYLSLISQPAGASASQRGSAVLLNFGWAPALRSSWETASWRLRRRRRPENCEKKFEIEAMFNAQQRVWNSSSEARRDHRSQHSDEWKAKSPNGLGAEDNVWNVSLNATFYNVMFSKSTTTKTDTPLPHLQGWLEKEKVAIMVPT